ncbi:MAG: sigma-54-dependent Fis family transcriptional regulator [Bacteroidales bacterium]|nr:sigma-54-dependent Fis family transcriptional regulator [Bacteroidales bacterium]
MKSNILIIDDNKAVLTALEMLLESEFNRIYTLKNPNSLISTIQQNNIDIILLDMNFKAGINTGNEGLYWLKQILDFDKRISVVMITAYGDIELAVKAVREGAFDFILKPWDNNKLISTLHSACNLRKDESDSSQRSNKDSKQCQKHASQTLIGQSAAIKQVMEMVKKVAATDANVFISGENGTGKELIAREIHNFSKRNNQTMVNVDMGAISDSLFESELFGHKKGSFTDAKEDRIGKLESADKGTLFLDEIGNLSLAHQAKMLATLQNRTVTKLGTNTPVPFDVRLITATNKDLNQMIEEGQFREDLFYRINTITIGIPPLRERENDVLLLAAYYLKIYAERYNKPYMSLDSKAENKLLKYSWPGNVRELQHCMEKAVILSEGKILTADNFSLNENHKSDENNLSNQTLEEMEKKMILSNIEKENGNMSIVAKKLGVTRQTLYNKLKKYGI